MLATARALARPGLAQALDAETLRRMLVAMIETYAAHDGAPHRARVLLSEADRAELEAHHAALFRDELAGGVELRPDPDLDRGFVVRFDGQDLVHDVTLDALSDVLASMVQPELTAVLRRAVAEPDAKASGEGLGAPRARPLRGRDHATVGRPLERVELRRRGVLLPPPQSAPSPARCAGPDLPGRAGAPLS